MLYSIWSKGTWPGPSTITWQPLKNADGYVVRYGVAPGKLYNSYLVYDAHTIRAESRKVRAKLQARVGEGRVRVGAAESGWWHTPAATDQRES